MSQILGKKNKPCKPSRECNHHTHTNQQSHQKANTHKQRPIEKGEGEYADYEDVK